MPSRRSASPSASPSGARLAGEHVLGALDERRPRRRGGDGLRHFDADRAAAEHEQAARDRLHAGRLAVASRRPRARAGRARAARTDRRRSPGRRGRRCGARRRPRRRPAPASRPLPRRRSMPCVGEPAFLAGVGVVRDHEVAPGERRLDVDLGGRRRVAARLARPRRVAAASSTGCTPSRSIHRRPARARRWRRGGRPAASAPAQCSPGEPPPRTMTS